MSDARRATADDATGIPPALAAAWRRLQGLPREDRMAAIAHQARKLEPVPERFREADPARHVVPECNTRVLLFAECTDGRMHYWAAVDTRQSPTVAAVCALTFAALNDQPPAVTLAVPSTFASRMMAALGLSARELGIAALLVRCQRHARAALEGSPQPHPIP
ncbi:MAG: SufE family protein [Gemmatimonadota bacterium]|nr:SufE family protein [Gemmatimonadota bacterium]